MMWFIVYWEIYISYTIAMYVDIVPNRNSRPAILLREG